MCSTDNLKVKLLKCLLKSQDIINSIVMLGGNFNAGHIDWENNTIETNASNWIVSEKLVEIIADNVLK